MPRSLSSRSFASITQSSGSALHGKNLQSLTTLLDKKPQTVYSAELLVEFFDNLPASVELPEATEERLRNHIGGAGFSETELGGREFVDRNAYEEIVSAVKTITKPDNGGSKKKSSSPKVSSSNTVSKIEIFLTKAYNSIEFVDLTYELHMPKTVLNSDDDELTKHLKDEDFLLSRLIRAFQLLTRQKSVTLRTARYIGRVLFILYTLKGRCHQEWKVMCETFNIPESTARSYRDFYCFVDEYPVFMRTNLSFDTIYRKRGAINSFFRKYPASALCWKEAHGCTDQINTSHSLEVGITFPHHSAPNSSFVAKYHKAQMAMAECDRYSGAFMTVPGSATDPNDSANSEANTFAEVPTSSTAEQVRSAHEKELRAGVFAKPGDCGNDSDASSDCSMTESDMDKELAIPDETYCNQPFTPSSM